MATLRWPTGQRGRLRIKEQEPATVVNGKLVPGKSEVYLQFKAGICEVYDEGTLALVRKTTAVKRGAITIDGPVSRGRAAEATRGLVASTLEQIPKTQEGNV